MEYVYEIVMYDRESHILSHVDDVDILWEVVRMYEEKGVQCVVYQQKVWSYEHMQTRTGAYSQLIHEDNGTVIYKTPGLSDKEL